MCNIVTELVTEFYLYSIVYIYLINSRLDVTFSVRHHFRTINFISDNKCTFVFDRYWAVGYPLRKRLTKSRAKVVIGIIWVASAALAAPELYASHVKPLPWLGEGKEGCDELWSDKERRIFTLFLLCFTYIIPVCLLMFTYLRIAMILYQRSQPDIRTHVQSQSTRKVRDF